ncbi:MAG: PEP-CTERM sorting domain-containing protein, partial [Pseudomonadota bacterium]
MKPSLTLTTLKVSAASALCLLTAATAAQAATIRVTVENLAPVDGFSLTPVYLGFHDGSFDLFDVGAAAS